MSDALPLTGLVVCLDDVSLDELVGPVEVLVQEGVRNFSLPASFSELAELVTIFGARARFGSHRVTQGAQIADSVAAGGSFALADLVSDELVAAAAEQCALYLPAMTPTELRQVLELPVAGAMLYPADIVGHAMAARLAELNLANRVVPCGGIGAYAAGEWFKAGVPAVCLDGVLLSDALQGGDLGSLRERCTNFVQQQPQPKD